PRPSRVLGAPDTRAVSQARAVVFSDGGAGRALPSRWAGFGGNSEADADFVTPRVLNNVAPGVPSFLGQFRPDGATPLEIGETTPQSGLVFKGAASDPNSDSWGLQVEVKPI